MLRRDVGGNVIQPFGRSHRSNGDDPALGVTAVGDERGRCRIDQTFHAEHVDRKDRVPVVVGAFPHGRASAEDPRGSHRDVEPAEVTSCRLHRQAHIGGTPDIANETEHDLSVALHHGIKIGLGRRA